MHLRHGTKVPILKEYHFGKMKLWRVEHVWTYLSSLLGVIAIVFSNHAQKWRQICPKVFNPSEFHSSEVTFLQNWYFNYHPISLRTFVQYSSYCMLCSPYKFHNILGMITYLPYLHFLSRKWSETWMPGMAYVTCISNLRYS